MSLVGRPFEPAGLADQRHVVLNEDAVMKNRDTGRRHEALISGELRRRPKNIVGLPFTRFAGGVYERRVLIINRTTGAVGIGFIVVGVQHLNFVTAQSKEDAAISSSLTIAVNHGRCREPEVELAFAEALQGT